MKSILPFFFLLAPLFSAAQSQGKEHKYKLSIPDNWAGKRSLLRHLTSIAPTVFARLEDKQVCLDCKTPYTLMFFYDSVSVVNRASVSLPSSKDGRFTISNYECVITYRFKATWTLLYKDSAIAELDLVSPNDEFMSRKKFSIQRDIFVWFHDNKPPKVMANPSDNPFAYITSHPENFQPTIDDILRAIEMKVRKIRPE